MDGAPPIRAVFLGAPGAGKGTQAQRLAAEAGFVHISTGDMLREHAARKTMLGVRAQAFMDEGKLVPDAIIIDMVRERIGQRDVAGAWILDGFPRTLPQAEALDAALAAAGERLSHAIWFSVSTDVLVARTTGRRTCTKCGAIWHVQFKPTRVEGVCDLCGGALTQRADDRLEAVTRRLAVYRQQTEPLLAYYRGRGLLTEVDAAQPPESVYRELKRVLERVQRGELS